MTKKLIISVFLLLILGGGLIVGLILVNQQQELRKKAAPATSLSIQPPTKTVVIGDVFTLSISVDTGENTLSAAELWIKFDPQKLNLTEFKPGTFPSGSIVLAGPTIDNTTGQAMLTLGSQVTNPQKGAGTLASLIFQAKSSGTAKVEFGTQTKAAGIDETTSLVVSKSPSTVTIAQGTSITTPVQTPTPPANQEKGGSTEQPASSTPTPRPTPQPTASLTPTPIGAAGGQLPQAGFSLPTTAAVLGGMTILLVGIILAF